VEEQFLEPEEVRRILLKLQNEALQIVLVGGQAINFWAMRYATEDEEWESLRPYTSTDIDLLGSPKDVTKIASILGGKAIVNREMDGGSPNTGIVLIPNRHGNLQIDILGSLFGLDAEEVANEALLFVGKAELAGVQLQIMDPFTALEGKLASLKGLSQHGRQDSKHVALCLLIIREFLRENWQNLDERRLLGVVKYIFKLARSDNSLHAWNWYSHKVEGCLPWELIDAQPSEKFEKFRQLNKEQLIQELCKSREEFARKQAEIERRNKMRREKNQE
jgi:hypothetical protein